MSDLLLHNYVGSPFAEKARLMLGFKQVEWDFVEIPTILPKPDLVALTGGYRKTPVLQVGRDIYCDTRIIQLFLERYRPDPAFLPKGQETLALELAQWADTSWFNTVVPICLSTRGLESLNAMMTPSDVKALMDDRHALIGGDFPDAGPCRLAFGTHARRLERHLASHPYLLGDAPTLVDIAHYHPLFLLGNLPTVASELEPYPNLRAWIQRVRAIGYGRFGFVPGAEAIERARGTTTWTEPLSPEKIEVDGVQLGDRVAIAPTDIGTQDWVRGELVICGPDEIAVRRSDPRAGEVTVHFPTIDIAVVPG
jgi:glutathione S-transferase